MTDPVFDIFREEARDHLSALETGFLDLETAAEVEARRPLIDNLFRHAHSLKSDAKVVGLRAMKEAAQMLEDVLDALRDAPERVDREAIDLGLSYFDAVRRAFDEWQASDSPAAHSATPPPGEPAPAPGPPESPLSTPSRKAARDQAVPGLEENFTVKVSSERLDRMLNLTGEARIVQRSAVAISDQLDNLREQLAAITRGAARRSAVETRQALESAQDRLRRIHGDLRKKRTREELLMDALETDIRQARLLPLMMLAEMIRRVVRDLAQSLGKAIRYEADVGKILLDKAVIEALRDPLMHLVRNAADHGLEMPDERRAAGKPEEGVIRFGASQRGPLVQIVVSDDGRGVNYERVRQRLRQMGAMDENEIRGLSEQELIDRLFHPGFSTAPAGEISGRGVGLDVVLDTLRRLQGKIDLHSRPGVGTQFVMTVPVTVATLRILTVLAGGQYYGVPSTAIVRTGRASRDELRELEGSPVLTIEGQPTPWLHLADLLGVAPARPAGEATWSYLLIDRQGKRLAVAVDDLEDETEVLLKPLGFPLQGLPGVVGAAVRADGSVQLVVDLAGVHFTQASNARPRTIAERPPAVRLLIVDDSPTTRAVLRNVFTAAGYSVRTATDGVDALERLRMHPVDLVITDVEMPRLGGLDLTRQIKSRFGLPVILVTGKEHEDHRREGLEAGADAYLVKSTFQGEGLLDIVRQLVG